MAAELQTIFRHFVDAEFAADSDEGLRLHGVNAATHLLARTDAQRRFDAFVTIFRTAAAASADGRTTAPPLDMVVNLICDQTSFETQLATNRLIDHLDEWVRDGGLTNLDNAGLQCYADNRNKQRTRLHVYRDPGGRPRTQRPDVSWIHPVGQRQQHPRAIAPPGDHDHDADPTDDPDQHPAHIEHLIHLARTRAAALR